eukprot:Tamp_01015.p1 GENE.Tamp_01015~~Tamp_01015.p1  ORF type:complete len:1554 (-),score=269.71 Tamp_01015:534-5195(-)
MAEAGQLPRAAISPGGDGTARQAGPPDGLPDGDVSQVGQTEAAEGEEASSAREMGGAEVLHTDPMAPVGHISGVDSPACVDGGEGVGSDREMDSGSEDDGVDDEAMADGTDQQKGTAGPRGKKISLSTIVDFQVGSEVGRGKWGLKPGTQMRLRGDCDRHLQRYIFTIGRAKEIPNKSRPLLLELPPGAKRALTDKEKRDVIEGRRGDAKIRAQVKRDCCFHQHQPVIACCLSNMRMIAEWVAQFDKEGGGEYQDMKPSLTKPGDVEYQTEENGNWRRYEVFRELWVEQTGWPDGKKFPPPPKLSPCTTCFPPVQMGGGGGGRCSGGVGGGGGGGSRAGIVRRGEAQSGRGDTTDKGSLPSAADEDSGAGRSVDEGLGGSPGAGFASAPEPQHNSAKDTLEDQGSEKGAAGERRREAASDEQRTAGTGTPGERALHLAPTSTPGSRSSTPPRKLQSPEDPGRKRRSCTQSDESPMPRSGGAGGGEKAASSPLQAEAKPAEATPPAEKAKPAEEDKPSEKAAPPPVKEAKPAPSAPPAQEAKPAEKAKPAEEAAPQPAKEAKLAEEGKPAEATPSAQEAKPAEKAKPAEEAKATEAAPPAGEAKPSEKAKPAEKAKLTGAETQGGQRTGGEGGQAPRLSKTTSSQSHMNQHGPKNSQNHGATHASAEPHCPDSGHTANKRKRSNPPASHSQRNQHCRKKSKRPSTIHAQADQHCPDSGPSRDLRPAADSGPAVPSVPYKSKLPALDKKANGAKKIDEPLSSSSFGPGVAARDEGSRQHAFISLPGEDDAEAVASVLELRTENLKMRHEGAREVSGQVHLLLSEGFFSDGGAAPGCWSRKQRSLCTIMAGRAAVDVLIPAAVGKDDLVLLVISDSQWNENKSAYIKVFTRPDAEQFGILRIGDALLPLDSANLAHRRLASLRVALALLVGSMQGTVRQGSVRQGTVSYPDGSHVANVTWQIEWRQWVQMDDNLSCLLAPPVDRAVAGARAGAAGTTGGSTRHEALEEETMDDTAVDLKQVHDVSLKAKLDEVEGLIGTYMAVTLEEYPNMNSRFKQDQPLVVERVRGGKFVAVSCKVLRAILDAHVGELELDALFPSSGCLEDYFFQNMLVLIHKELEDAFLKLNIPQGKPRRILGFMRSRTAPHSAQSAIQKITDLYKEEGGIDSVCVESAKKRFWGEEGKCLRVQSGQGGSVIQQCARKVRQFFWEKAPIGDCSDHFTCLDQLTASRTSEIQSRENRSKGGGEHQRRDQDVQNEDQVARRTMEDRRQKVVTMCEEVNNAPSLEKIEQKLDLRERVKAWFVASDKSKKIVMLKEGLILSLMRSGWLNISSTRSGSALPDRNMMRLALQMLEGLLGKSECRIQVTHKNGVTNGPLSHLFDEFASCFARTFYHGGAAGGYSIEQKVAEEAQTGEARKILDRLTELMEGLKDASNKLVPLEKQLKSSYDRSEDQEDKKWWIDSSRLNCILSLRRSEGLGLLDEMRKAVEKAPTFSETPRLIWKKERDGRSQGGRWEWEGAGESSTGKQKHIGILPQHFPAKKQRLSKRHPLLVRHPV